VDRDHLLTAKEKKQHYTVKKKGKLSESKKNSTINNSNTIIEEAPVIIESISWTN
jgi:hypothetical protein